MPSTLTTAIALLLLCVAMAGRGSFPWDREDTGLENTIGTETAVVLKTAPSERSVRTNALTPLESVHFEWNLRSNLSR